MAKDERPESITSTDWGMCPNIKINMIDSTYRLTLIGLRMLAVIFLEDTYLLAPSGRRIRKPARYRADYHDTDNVVDAEVPGKTKSFLSFMYSTHLWREMELTLFVTAIDLLSLF